MQDRIIDRIEDDNLRAFAQYCYDAYSIDELKILQNIFEHVAAGPLTKDQFREGVRNALYEKYADEWMEDVGSPPQRCPETRDWCVEEPEEQC